ncbi:MAG: motility associated factor glycosyltransferase family protein [Curvibacter sp.]|nr:motility associated factor glycosyltransferase family protein [Curvibacter sp.]
MTLLFEQQMSLIQDRWPSLHRRLRTLLDDKVHPVPDVQRIQGRAGTLSIAGLQLSSRHAPEAEALRQAGTLPKAKTLHIYGPALGELPRTLLSTRKRLKRLAVHLLNPQVFLLVLKNSDQSDWMQDERVQIDLAADYAEVSAPFFAHPAELVLADNASARVRDRLIAENTLNFVRQTFRPDHPLLSRRLSGNTHLIQSDPDVSSLFASAPGRPAVVVGTGPSLEKMLPELQQIHQQAPRPLFIAADTALRPLTLAGITPDVVVSIDHRTQARFLQCPEAERITLVYAPVLPTEVLEAWPGPRLCSYSMSALYAGLRRSLPRSALFNGGSVIHPAVDLAVKMGAQQVTLYGTDFCFPGGKTHAHWPAGELHTDLDSARHWVLNGRGERVPTHANFASYLVELERYIRRHPGVRFIQASLDSARIAGSTSRKDAAPCP